MHFALITFIAATPFQIPQTDALFTSISTACQIYAPATTIGKHIRAVFPSQTLPPLTSYASQASGLVAALKADTFGSMEEFNAFLANVLWESICLSTKTESCGTSCPDAPYQGRGYIQITGQANYQAFANFVGNQGIMTNPDIVATDESLSWGSAIFFWTSNCKGASSVGAGTMCVNSPECAASSTSSSRYFQFAPYYRLTLEQNLGLGSDTTTDSRTACAQMNVGLDQSWMDFCRFHGNDKSVNCPFVVGNPNPVVGSAPGTTSAIPAPGTTAAPSTVASPAAPVASGASSIAGNNPAPTKVGSLPNGTTNDPKKPSTVSSATIFSLSAVFITLLTLI
jgi:hypothetical protein